MDDILNFFDEQQPVGSENEESVCNPAAISIAPSADHLEELKSTNIQQPIYPEVTIPELKQSINAELGLSENKGADTAPDILANNNQSLLDFEVEIPSFVEITNNAFDSPERPIESLARIEGAPQADIVHWHQQSYPDTCAIVSQEYVIESFIDVDLTEEQLREMAIEKQYYTPGGGTFPEDVGNIIEDFGILVERSCDNTFEELIDKLSNNHKVIVGLDANEIWSNSVTQQIVDLFGYPEANHAVQVIGYNSEEQTVILNDPGHPNGRGLEVSLTDFTLAWDDSNNFMMSTVDPAPLAQV